ncbi:MAG TPA: invasion associated locus B family protein [Rhizomicrobium sp.]|nr:invasion associated locus B family protein [Rhizomicrobium sp.]
MNSKFLSAGVFAGLLSVCGAASAQQGAVPPSPPEIKTVGDWQVRCFAVQNANPCDVFQEMADQNTRQRILSISLAYAPSMDRHLLQITVPLEVSIPKGITIQTDSFTSPVMKYRMCTREGCFVQLAPDNAMIESLVKSGADAKLNIWADNGKSYALKFSLKGFAQAHDDMVAQAKAKAKPAKDSAPAKPN